MFFSQLPAVKDSSFFLSLQQLFGPSYFLRDLELAFIIREIQRDLSLMTFFLYYSAQGKVN